MHKKPISLCCVSPLVRTSETIEGAITNYIASFVKFIYKKLSNKNLVFALKFSIFKFISGENNPLEAGLKKLTTRMQLS
jgi:hypothetical protein